MVSPSKIIKEKEYHELEDDLKRKISEVYLLIKSGALSSDQLRQAEEILASLKTKIESQGTRLRSTSGSPDPGPLF